MSYLNLISRGEVLVFVAGLFVLGARLGFLGPAHGSVIRRCYSFFHATQKSEYCVNQQQPGTVNDRDYATEERNEPENDDSSMRRILFPQQQQQQITRSLLGLKSYRKRH